MKTPQTTKLKVRQMQEQKLATLPRNYAVPNSDLRM